jgi:hypothetical protein
MCIGFAAGYGAFLSEINLQKGVSLLPNLRKQWVFAKNILRETNETGNLPA